MNVKIRQCPVLQDVCLSTNLFILSVYMIVFVDERPKQGKNLLSCLSDTMAAEIATKHKGDD